MKHIPVQDKVAVITGGASGMGKAMAIRLLGYGARVIVLDTNEAQLGEMSQKYPAITVFTCDVSDGSQIRNTASRIEQQIGPVSFLMHGAAIMPGAPLQRMAPETIQKVMQINYSGTVEVAAAFLPAMLKRRTGTFVTFGSIVGEIPIIKFGAYGASKAATNYFMKVLMDEHRNSGLQFLLVCPPAVNTPLIDQAVKEGPGQLQEMKAGKRRMLSPEAVLDAVEKALLRKQRIVYPGEAKIMQLAWRFIPTLVRYVTLKTN